MNNVFLVFWAMLGCSSLVRGQGFPFDTAAYMRLPAAAPWGDKTGIGSLRPAGVSLAAYCPPVRDMGDAAAEAAWALGYYAQTIACAAQADIKDRQKLEDLSFSASFLYSRLAPAGRSNCYTPVSVESVLEMLQREGNCRWKDFDKGLSDCRLLPSEYLLQQAKENRIAGAERLFEPGDAEERKCAALERCLAARQPAVLLLPCFPSLLRLPRGSTHWRPTESEASRPLPSTFYPFCLIGYNPYERCVELVSQQGEQWGDRGRVLVRYEDIGRYCPAAYRLLPPSKQSTTVGGQPVGSPPLSGSFSIHAFTGSGFAPAVECLLRQGAVYTQPIEQHPGGGYILHFEGSQGARYLYILTLDPAGNKKLLFPADNLSAAIPSSSSSLRLPIVSPGKDPNYWGYRYEHHGEDWVCYLLSTRPIDDIQSRLHRLSARTPFPDEVRRVFGDLLLPENEALYQDCSMGFELKIRKEGAVALFLKTQIR